MDSGHILNAALESIYQSILKASNAEALPELNLYSPLDTSGRSSDAPSEAESELAKLQRLEIDEQDDQKSEPGLQSSLRHSDQQVSTATSERARNDGASRAVEDWFGGISWSKDDVDAVGGNQEGQVEKSTRTSATGLSQSTEDFFTGVDWDADSNDDQSTNDLGLLDESRVPAEWSGKQPEDAADFFESTNWDGEPQQEDKAAQSTKSDKNTENAETFLGGTDWDGHGKTVSVNPDGEPPPYIKELADSDRSASRLPANEDAVGRSKSSEPKDGKE